MALFIDVAMVPGEALAMDADCYVVVDALRATSTIATLFQQGLDRLFVTDQIDLARATGALESAVLFGEVGGLRPEGFDFGNSPVEANTAVVAGRAGVLFTSNGTRVLCQLAGRGAVFTGALANAGAVARAVGGFPRVAIVCAGTAYARRFALEDFVAAGTIVRRLLAAVPTAQLGDAAALAAELPRYDDWTRTGLHTGEASGSLFAASEHARKLRELGLEADVAFAIQEDTSMAAPRVSGHGEGWALLTV